MRATVRSLAHPAALALALAILAGCAHHPPSAGPDQGGNTYAPRDSIIVPDEQSVLSQRLRQALAERGWHLVGYSGDMTSGHADYQAMARRAKYRLTLMGTPVGRCRNGDPSFLYRIAIIQNTDGDVPVAMSGAECLGPIVAEFADDLDQKQLAPMPGRASAAQRSSAPAQ